MKKNRMIWIALAALAALALGVFGFKRQSPTLQTTKAPEVAAGRDYMQVRCRMLGDLRTLTGTQAYTVANRTGEDQSELVLRVYANAQQERSFVITGAYVDGRAAAWRVEGDDGSVLRVACDWPDGKAVTLTLEFQLTIPANAGGLLTRDAERCLMIGALPTLAVYADGEWNTAQWDALAEPSYAPAFDGSIALTLPRGVTPVFGGALTGVQSDGAETTYTAALTCARDVSLAVGKGGAVRQKTTNGVLLTAMARDAGTAERLLSGVKEALSRLAAVGLSYPLPALNIVQADTGYQEGMAVSSLLIVPDNLTAEQMTRLAARQLFGIVVESDPQEEPWLSHTLASAAELLAYRQKKGEAAYLSRYENELTLAERLTRPMGVTVGAGVASFGSEAEMMQVLAEEGGAMLLGIGMAAGEAQLAEGLSCYVSPNAGGFGSMEKLCAALMEVTGSAWDGYIADGLAN